MKKISIIGGGPAGLSMAYYAYENNNKFCLHEASSHVGGYCSTINHAGFLFDTGAHRLHNKDQETTEIFKNLLKNDLKLIHVSSQIYSNNRYIDFPISPLNLIKYFSIYVLLIEFVKIIWKKLNKSEKIYNFKEISYYNYGKKIADEFLINYSEKLWGLNSELLSKEIAGNRLKGISIRTLIIEFLFGKKTKTKHLDGSFYYPKYGIGTLFDSLSKKIFHKNLHLNDRVIKIKHSGNSIISFSTNKRLIDDFDHLVSTIPINLFLNCLEPKPPKKILNISNKINFRNIILVCFFLDKNRINKNGSMYFPSKKFPFTRIYEPNNRSKFMSPNGKTSLVVELPCFDTCEFWKMSEKDLINKIKTFLFDLKYFNQKDIIDNKIVKLSKAYPVLEKNYSEKIKPVYDYLKKFNNLTISGRNGLFKYNHIHDHFINARHDIKNINKI